MAIPSMVFNTARDAYSRKMILADPVLRSTVGNVGGTGLCVFVCYFTCACVCVCVCVWVTLSLSLSLPPSIPPHLPLPPKLCISARLTISCVCTDDIILSLDSVTLELT